VSKWAREDSQEEDRKVTLIPPIMTMTVLRAKRCGDEDPYARKQLDSETERIHVPNYEVPYAQK
jgi:hypothetical protein